jgi:hypothetical protein
MPPPVAMHLMSYEYENKEQSAELVCLTDICLSQEITLKIRHGRMLNKSELEVDLNLFARQSQQLKPTIGQQSAAYYSMAISML